MPNNLSLLSSMSRVETPFIKVTIGDYVFGVAQKTKLVIDGTQTVSGVQYPNYIESLEIEKINGQVNKYTLSVKYPVTENDDPNFFDKVLSSISKSRKITFEYGDLSNPSFCYRNEEALFLKATEGVYFSSSVISYKIYAVSACDMLSQGNHNFDACHRQPSALIEDILYGVMETGNSRNASFDVIRNELFEVFPGMRDRAAVTAHGLIVHDDMPVDIQARTNMTIFDYLKYLVSCMRESASSSSTGGNVFSLVVMDDTSGELGGPYFKVQKASTSMNVVDAYELDIGFPSQSIVTDFSISNSDNYSIYYDFENEHNDAQYVYRINDDGDIVKTYAPPISSKTSSRTTTESQRSWWENVTKFPIKSKITVRGLLKPAILMTNVRLNVLFFGKSHISSGLYVVTGEKDNIDEKGFRTTLSLLRVDGVPMLGGVIYDNEGIDKGKTSRY